MLPSFPAPFAALPCAYTYSPRRTVSQQPQGRRKTQGDAEAPPTISPQEILPRWPILVLTFIARCVYWCSLARSRLPLLLAARLLLDNLRTLAIPQVARPDVFESFTSSVVPHIAPSPRRSKCPSSEPRGSKKTAAIFGEFGRFTPNTTCSYGCQTAVETREVLLARIVLWPSQVRSVSYTLDGSSLSA